MKKFISVILLPLFLYGCCDEKEIFTGFIVAKEYTPEHMSNQGSYPVSYAVVVPIIAHPPAPHKVYAEWVWFVANRDCVIRRCVSKEMFNTKKCGEKVTVKRY
jgi:hypothetical protein